ncbi:MAG: tetratricopeptide repeat protein [Pseudomonadota bacterium]
MKITGSFPALLGTVALLSATCLRVDLARSEPASGTQVPGSLQGMSRQDWNRALIRHGHTSERLGQKQDALADYTLAIESHALINNDQVQALFDRGLLLDGMGRLKDALADYGTALSLSPNFVAALNNRASIYTRLGLYAEARRDYLSALARGSPESQYSYFGLGQVAEIQGSLTEAGDFYNRALAVAPQFDLAKERLALLASNHQGVQSQRSVGNAPLPGAESDSNPQAPVPVASAGQNTMPAPPAPDGVGIGAQVQLGAWRSEENAAKGWNHARTLAGGVLDGVSPRIVAVDLPEVGRFYRLRIGVAQTGSRSFCAALMAKGLDCIPVQER